LPRLLVNNKLGLSIIIFRRNFAFENIFALVAFVMAKLNTKIHTLLSGQLVDLQKLLLLNLKYKSKSMKITFISKKSLLKFIKDIFKAGVLFEAKENCDNLNNPHKA